MNIPSMTDSNKRLIMAIGRHQDGEKNMSELAEEIGVELNAINRKKWFLVENDFIDERKHHTNKILELTDKGEQVYEALEDMNDAMED